MILRNLLLGLVSIVLIPQFALAETHVVGSVSQEDVDRVYDFGSSDSGEVSDALFDKVDALSNQLREGEIQITDQVIKSICMDFVAANKASDENAVELIEGLLIEKIEPALSAYSGSDNLSRCSNAVN